MGKLVGCQPGKPKKRTYHHKTKVLSLVDRDTKQARSIVVDDLKPATVVPVLQENIAGEAKVMTDEAGHDHHLRKLFSEHNVVRRGQEEYVSKDNPHVHTNTIEGCFSVFKRRIKGVYEHSGEKHLHRYPLEFDLRNGSCGGIKISRDPLAGGQVATLSPASTWISLPVAAARGGRWARRAANPSEDRARPFPMVGS